MSLVSTVQADALPQRGGRVSVCITVQQEGSASESI